MVMIVWHSVKARVYWYGSLISATIEKKAPVPAYANMSVETAETAWVKDGFPNNL